MVTQYLPALCDLTVNSFKALFHSNFPNLKSQEEKPRKMN